MNLQSYSPGGLSISEQEQIAQYLKNALSENTRKAYERDFGDFEKFCLDRLTPAIPAPVHVIAAYVAHLDSEGKKLSTIERRICAISHYHKAAREESPTGQQSIKTLMRGLRRGKRSEGKKKAPAIPLGFVEEIAGILEPMPDLKSIRNRALLLVGFFGAFRRSELSVLRWSDLEKSEQGFTAVVRYSKTDQEGKGMVKVIPYRANASACPVRALEALRFVNESEYIFCGVTKKGEFRNSPITGSGIEYVFKELVGTGFSPHSLRSGFITAAAKADKPEREISAQTGHKHMPTLRGYIRRVNAWDGNAAVGL